eukprot:2118905-Rhodomonas_salina.1
MTPPVDPPDTAAFLWDAMGGGWAVRNALVLARRDRAAALALARRRREGGRERASWCGGREKVGGWKLGGC